MRIIAGTAKNRKLRVPPGNNTRPITDMIKEALFNVLGHRIQAADFLDLFAGSGSVGIEALSRGAKSVIFVDNNNGAVKTIYHNLKSCNFKEGFKVYKNDVFKALDIIVRKELKFNIIYIDPPFTNAEIFDQIMLSLDGNSSLLNENGIIIIRSPHRLNMPAEYKNLIRSRLNKYGESVLHYYLLKS